MVTRGVEDFVPRLPEDVVLLFDEAYAEYADGPSSRTGGSSKDRGRPCSSAPFPRSTPSRGFASVQDLHGGIPATSTGCASPYNVNLLRAGGGPREPFRRGPRAEEPGLRARHRLLPGVLLEGSSAISVRNDGLGELLPPRDGPARGLSRTPSRAAASSPADGLVRPPERFVRITVGTPEANRRLAGAIEALLAERG
jgi:hypothetical protein